MILPRRGHRGGGMTRGVPRSFQPVRGHPRLGRPPSRFFPPRRPVPTPQRPLSPPDLLEFDLIDIDVEIEYDAGAPAGGEFRSLTSTRSLGEMGTDAKTMSTLFSPSLASDSTAPGGVASITEAAALSLNEGTVEYKLDLATFPFDFSSSDKPAGTPPAHLPAGTPSPADEWVAAGLPTLSTTRTPSPGSDSSFEWTGWPYTVADSETDAWEPPSADREPALESFVADAVAPSSGPFVPLRRVNTARPVASFRPRTAFRSLPGWRLPHHRVGPQRPPRLIHPLPRKPSYSLTPLLTRSTQVQQPVRRVRSTPPPAQRVPPVLTRLEAETDDSSEDEPSGPLSDELEDFSLYLLPGMSILAFDDILHGSAFNQYFMTRRRRFDYLPIQPYGTPSRLQQEIVASWCRAEPSATQKAAIDNIIRELNQLINLHGPAENNPTRRRYQVDVFGSLAWGGGVGDGAGDLDLVVIDTLNPQGYTPQFWVVPPGQPPQRNGGRRRQRPLNVPKVYNMDVLGSILVKGGMQYVQRISWATTPIVKFRIPSSDGIDLHCDINVNDLGGWYNSSLILAYCDISPDVLRPMIHTLKKWAKAHKVNNPAGKGDTRTLSSYCLTLMAIAYLQFIGVLPNLQADVKVPQRLDDADVTDCENVIWVGWGRDQGTKARIWFRKHPPPGWRSAQPGLTAADAVIGFFDFLRGNGFNYAKQCLSILNGGVIDRAPHRLGPADVMAERHRLIKMRLQPAEFMSRIAAFEDKVKNFEVDEQLMGKGNGDIQPRKWSESTLVVQDPFIWDKNCASGMSKEGSDRFWKAVTDTYNVLVRRGHNTILAELLFA